MINDFNEVRGTDIQKLDPNNASIEKTTENPFFPETTSNVVLKWKQFTDDTIFRPRYTDS